jgi:two-component system NarL family sensor kinase
VAALSVGIVVVLKETAATQRALEATPLLLAAVGITTWYGGVGPGLLAMSLATAVVDYYFIPPLDAFGLSLKDVPSLVMFGASAVFFVWVSAALRVSQQALRNARDEMEDRVRERTAELAQTNQQLQAEIGERKEAEQELDDLAGRLINAQEEERSRIGRELHDHVSQRLGLLAIKIDQLRLNPTATIASALDELRQQTGEITDDIHGLSHRLHSSMLDHLGVVPALQRLVKECSQRYAIPIAFTHASLPAPVPSELALCLFRVVEESLANIAKHSRAASARVDLGADDTTIRLTVADDGMGFDPSSVKGRSGLGFVSMRERLRLVHGTIDVRSAPAQGTTINVRVPSKSRTI